MLGITLLLLLAVLLWAANAFRFSLPRHQKAQVLGLPALGIMRQGQSGGIRSDKATLLQCRPAKWSSDVDEFAERINSGKALVLSSVVGSIGVAPINVAGAFILGQGLSAEWEFRTDMLAVCLGLFGVVYRYAVRSDPNPQLKLGVVGAFALTRTLNLVDISDSCAALPLNCGPPFGYVSYDMISQGLISGIPSLFAFALSAVALETALNNNWIGRMK